MSAGFQGRYLDDFATGEVFETDGYTFTDSEIIGFASRFDPQPFHLDVDAAARSPYGGLIASGFHTVAVCFRLFIQRGLLIHSSIGSPGMDEVRWFAPVRPGDTLRTRVEVLEVRPSRTRPDRGILRARYAALNQHGEEVLGFIANHLLARRGD